MERIRSVTVSVVVCAYNEASLLPACLSSLLAQTRPVDEIIVVDNASTDATSAVARAVPGVRVIEEPTKGLVVARETARRAASGDIVAYVDADCRVPPDWLAKVEQRFLRRERLVAVTGPYRFYDWDVSGRALIGAYDLLVAPATHALVHQLLGIGAILYGGNFAVRREALAQIGGFDPTIEFHGEDTNLGRRLTPLGPIEVRRACWVWTSARRYRALGKRHVIGLYVRNFWSEILRHRPADRTHEDVRA
jgi:glycosyltransferase involved in cell wall biosynthesis